MKKGILFILVLLASSLSFAQGTIRVRYAGSSATVDIAPDVAGVTYTVNGANVALTSTTTSSEYTYIISGHADDGSLLISGVYKMTLRLDGLSLTNSHGGAAIDIECGKRIAVELAEGTVNTLCDSPAGGQKAALYFKGHPEFKGGGTLRITGKAKHAICAKEYIELKPSTGLISVLGAVSDGIHCGKGEISPENNYFLMNGGTVDISGVGSDGIDADDYGAIRINGGALSINVGSAATALKADSVVSISGGLVNLSVRGDDSEAVRARYAVDVSGGTLGIVVVGDGSKGIRSRRITEASTVLNGGFVSISGGTTEIYVSGARYDDGLGGTSSCAAISADADFVMTNGSVYIVAMGKEASACDVGGTDSRQGGTLEVVRTPWQMDVFAFEHDMSVYYVVEEGGNRLPSLDGKAVGAFIGGECVGYGIPLGSGLGMMRVRQNTTETAAVAFRVYDYGTSKEYEALADREVTFSPMACWGTPSSPVVLGYEPWLRGDVNADGDVNLVDLMMIVDHLLGISNADFHFNNADLDCNGEVSLVDLMIEVDILLGKEE